MHTKRPRCDDNSPEHHQPVLKRPRPPSRWWGPRPAPRVCIDRLTPLSDELLLRILSFLSVDQLLFSVAPVSRHFHRLSGDSQLWKAHYYARFVLPRAMRIPGFREGSGANTRRRGEGHKLHYSGRRRLWADGRRGGLVVTDRVKDRSERLGLSGYGDALPSDEERSQSPVNWKRQYKIRHNWARGKCAVEELRLGEGEAEPERKVLVKVIEGVAITADARFGLRAWDLKTREVVAHTRLDDRDEGDDDLVADETPSCIAIDEGDAAEVATTVAVGFQNGGFTMWKLHLGEKRFERLYQHPMSRNGELIGMALSFPYLLTATRSVLVSLYTFDVPAETAATDSREHRLPTSAKSRAGLPPPYLLTSLKSHTSRAPLALSIRTTAATTIASIAYTFSTRNGWSIGMQDLHIKPNPAAPRSPPEITATKLAYTAAVDTGVSTPPSSTPQTPQTSPIRRAPLLSSPAPKPQPPSTAEPGPTTLCYAHPYLLAALPDNTLALHLVTSTADALTLSDPGIRLWGHTSAVGDAEITARGRAVSVSGRGDEMRVWELEGGSRSGGGSGGGRSVEIRACADYGARGDGEGEEEEVREEKWEERKNWVGFDDEMVIVLKEGRGGRESLLVYDFT